MRTHASGALYRALLRVHCSINGASRRALPISVSLVSYQCSSITDILNCSTAILNTVPVLQNSVFERRDRPRAAAIDVATSTIAEHHIVHATPCGSTLTHGGIGPPELAIDNSAHLDVDVHVWGVGEGAETAMRIP